jgi:predicted ATPase
MEEGMTSTARLLQSAEELRAIAGKYDFSYFFAIGNIMRGWGLGTGGQSSEGIPLLLQGLTALRATGCNAVLPFYLTMLAEVYGKAGQPQEGLDRLTEAGTLVETTQERWAEAEMHRVRGTLLLSLHAGAVAEDSYHQALAVARQQSAKFWELRAATSLARLWRDQGKRTEARDLVATIYDWFTEGFDTPVLQNAKALLDQLA